MRVIRMLVAVCVWSAASGAVWAGSGENPSNPAMKALFDEMKINMETEKSYREGKKIEMQSVEAEIDKLRAAAKAKGETQDPAAVRPLQLKRLAILEEVAQRDVETAQKGIQYAQRKFEIAQQNLDTFRQKKAEAEKSIAS